MVIAQRSAHLHQVPVAGVAWRFVVFVGACGQRDECLLSAAAKRERNEYVIQCLASDPFTLRCLVGLVCSE